MSLLKSDPPTRVISQSALTSDELACLCLAMTPELGPKAFQSIVQSQYAVRDVFDLDDSTLKSLGLRGKAVENLRQYAPSRLHPKVEATLTWVEQSPINHLLLYGQAAYPEQLAHIGAPPPMLLVRGQLSALQQHQMAIVGSRYPTEAGKQQAFEFAAELADAGLVITSGLAKGVDAAAHQGALSVQGSTLAVLGTGLNEIYPKSHQALAEAIVEKGALISEFPLDTKAFQGNFPRRNRIVSGLSLGTLVVEAALKSGSLITARQALEQNREVFAIPGPINNPQKTGCHFLIREGATLIESPDQILQALADVLSYQKAINLNTADIAAAKQARPHSDDPQQARLLKALDYEGANVDTLVSRSGLDAASVAGLLMLFELQGWVSHAEGEYALC